MRETRTHFFRQAAVLLLLLCLTAAAAMAQSDRTRRIRFARGRTTKVIKDAVVRGTSDRYL
ncbi:MAG TPA: hypothetical protein VGC64_09875, partial [Pyrinomonadaceae bacterium]